METVTSTALVKVIGCAGECMRTLMKAGLTFDALQAPIDDADMRKLLVRFWNSGGYEATSTQKAARAIMSDNFFGIEEAITYFDVCSTRSELSAIAEIPFTESELRAAKDTHVLVAVFPLSILDIRDRVSGKTLPNGQRFFYEQSWYKKQAFAKDRGGVHWTLVRKTPVENSSSMNWREQQTLLSDKEEIPTARALVYTIIGHFLATGERLFEKTYVRCSDMDSSGYCVDVGGFDADGMGICEDWDDVRRDGEIGLSSARKSR